LNSNEVLISDSIEISVSGTFKTKHTFNSPEGSLGSLVIKGSKGEGVYSGAKGQVIEFKKPSAWKNIYELHEGKNKIASAHPPKKLKPDFDVEFNGQVYQLSPGGRKGRSWTLENDQGNAVCEVSPRGGLKRGAAIEITTPLSIRLLVFTYSLVAKKWQEEAYSADALDD